MLIDEDFVKSDLALAGKIAAVVRRYFPEVQVLLVVRQPQQWQALCALVGLPELAKDPRYETTDLRMAAAGGGW